MKKITLSALLVALALSGCNDEPTHDVQYYLDHPKERTEKVAECDNNPGQKAITTNCINAAEAQRKAMFQGEEMPKIR